MKLNYRKLLWFGSIMLLLSILLMIIVDVWFIIMFFVSLFIANWSGHQEALIDWNHGICKDTNDPWEFKEYVEYTETADYLFYSGEFSILVSANSDIYYKEYKGKNRF